MMVEAAETGKIPLPEGVGRIIAGYARDLEVSDACVKHINATLYTDVVFGELQGHIQYPKACEAALRVLYNLYNRRVHVPNSWIVALSFSDPENIHAIIDSMAIYTMNSDVQFYGLKLLLPSTQHLFREWCYGRQTLLDYSSRVVQVVCAAMANFPTKLVVYDTAIQVLCMVRDYSRFHSPSLDAFYLKLLDEGFVPLVVSAIESLRHLATTEGLEILKRLLERESESVLDAVRAHPNIRTILDRMDAINAQGLLQDAGANKLDSVRAKLIGIVGDARFKEERDHVQLPTLVRIDARE